MGVRRLAVVNGPNIFQMLLVITITLELSASEERNRRRLTARKMTFSSVSLSLYGRGKNCRSRGELVDETTCTLRR